MKKIIVLLVAATLVAAPAFAVIRNSKHDLSMSSTATVKSGNTSETCVFCHTPHGGITGIMAPLWNRSIPGGGIVVGDLYNSATLDQINSRPSIVLTEVQNSDAPLCLSCHDGGSLAGGLVNPPNGTLQPSGGTLATGVTGQMDLGTAGTLLVNDHPIGMDYSAVYGLDNLGFEPETDATAIGALPLYTANGVMWCSTCHDVHNQGPVGATPFLNMSNVGSALCTTCHIK